MSEIVLVTINFGIISFLTSEREMERGGAELINSRKKLHIRKFRNVQFQYSILLDLNVFG